MAVFIYLHTAVFGLARSMRWSYLPPLMVYLAAGISGLTAIVGTFFVKDYLGLSAAFLAGLTFWAGLPWALNMPLGHLVDICGSFLRDDKSQRPIDSLKAGSSYRNSPCLLSAKLEPSKISSSFPPTWLT